MITAIRVWYVRKIKNTRPINHTGAISPKSMKKKSSPYIPEIKGDEILSKYVMIFAMCAVTE